MALPWNVGLVGKMSVGLGKESWPIGCTATSSCFLDGGMIVHDFSIFFFVGMNVNLSAFHCFDRTMSLESGR